MPRPSCTVADWTKLWRFSGTLLLLWLPTGVWAEDADESGGSQPRVENPEIKLDKPRLGIDKLDRKSRAKALSGLAGLVILGLGMIVLVWMGARLTRRYMNPEPFDHQRIKSSAPPADDWASKPLVEKLDDDDT